ncbi:MAG: hypothetical protein ACREUW_03785 [Burkholderiales bacterium]
MGLRSFAARIIETTQSFNLLVDKIVICTGPLTDYSKINDPLVRSMIKEGLARPDLLKLGFDSHQDSSLIGAEGLVKNNLYTIGPPLRSISPEATAISEIRSHADKLAVALLM